MNRVIGCSLISAHYLSAVLGKYIVPVPIGMTVEFEVNFRNHTFERISYPSRQSTGIDEDNTEFFNVLRPTDKMDFEDTSKMNVTVELSGGLCNATLGNATIIFTRQAQCGVNFRMEKNLTAFSTVIELPAHFFEYEFGVLRTNLPTFNLAVRDYLIRADNNTGEFDLTNISDTTMNRLTRFEYHPLPTLTLSFNGMDQTPCTDRQRSFLMIESQSRTNATIRVSEDYPAGLEPAIASCTNIKGQINITNSLGEDIEDKPLLSVCRETCPMDVMMDSRIVTTYVTVCAVNVPDNATAKLSCPSNGVMETISFANYGARATGACSRTFSNSGCRAARTLVVTTRECRGKNNCTISINPTKFGSNTCASNVSRVFTAQVLCRIDTPVYENARVQLPLQIGYPNRLRPFMKTFVTRMNVLGYIDDILIVRKRDLRINLTFR